jgi:hypothetical protein
MKSKGVVYIATGKKFVDEALVSARSVRKCMPELPIALFTDIEELVTNPPVPVNEVFLMTDVRKSCLDKMFPLLDSPYEKTLFLDTDTYMCDRVDELFEALDQFDILAAHPPFRVQYEIEGIPECFPEPNTGVIAFRNSKEAFDVIRKWPVEYERQLASIIKPHHDQHSFRAALYGSEARFLVIPHEYNFRSIGPNFAGKGCKVKIIHGRHASFERVEQRLNRNLDYRVFLTHPFRVLTHDFATYKSGVEALSNYIFENLPGSLQDFLSRMRRTIRS